MYEKRKYQKRKHGAFKEHFFVKAAVYQPSLTAQVPLITSTHCPVHSFPYICLTKHSNEKFF